MTRRLVRVAALAIAVAGLAWAFFLIASDGVDLLLLGQRIRAHAPVRPLLVAALALTGFLLSTPAAGPPVRRRWVGRIVDPRVGAGALALAIVTVGVSSGTMVGGGSDSYGYLSQAELWYRGKLVQDQSWADWVPWPDKHETFMPLGYAVGGNPSALAPVYGPGLPMMMAAAKVVAGQCGVFWVVPLCGAVLVLSTFALGRRVGDPIVGLMATWLLATTPIVLFMIVQPMSDVPVAAAWTLSWLLLLHRGSGIVAAAGLLAGAAALIRPNLAPLAALFPVWSAFVAMRTTGEARRRLVKRGVAYILGVLPAAIVLASLNWLYFGSPLKSGYGELRAFFALENFWPNIGRYCGWLYQTQGITPFVALAALAIPTRWIWPRSDVTWLAGLLRLFVAGIVVQYLFYTVFDPWWYLRFLLPCYPLMMIAVALLVRRLIRAWPIATTTVLVIATLAVGLLGVRFAVHEFVFSLWLGERKYVTAAQAVRTHTDRQSVILSIQHSGSMRYYGGRITMRYDYLDRAWLDGALAWLADHGAHPYLLAEEWELDEVKRKFAGQVALRRLEGPPVLVYSGSNRVYLYDLAETRPATAEVDTITETYAGPFCVTPAARPPFEFTNVGRPR